MASSQLMTKNESLATTASEETSGLESAVVFEGESLKTCGHTHKWVPLMDYLESCGSKKTLCPTCKAPIVLVCDGTAATMGHHDNSQDKQHKRMVTFKYRNHLYKLSVQRAHGGGFPVPLSYCIWLWRSMLQIMGENTSVTVQERISQALRMDMEGHMKVNWPQRSPFSDRAKIRVACSFSHYFFSLSSHDSQIFLICCRFCTKGKLSTQILSCRRMSSLKSCWMFARRGANHW